MTNHRLLVSTVSICALMAIPAIAQPTAQKVFDQSLSGAEKEFLSLVAAMPADKFSFAPTGGKFDGVRTFGMQARHVAYVVNEIAATLLSEPIPPTGKSENGPDELTTKEEILAYAKGAFARAHKAIAQMTNTNMLDQLTDPFNPKGKRTRVDSVSIMVWHTFDHYGQMVVYARMNGVVPPASQ